MTRSAGAAVLLAIALAVSAGPRGDVGPPATLTIEPPLVESDHSSPRSLILVTVRDAAGRRVPWTAVDFTSADTTQIVFPNPRSVTNAEGIAANFCLRAVNYPITVDTTLTVRAGLLESGPVAVTASNIIADGNHQFTAPPLVPFTSVRQLLQGSEGIFFAPVPEGEPASVWAIDPTVAEPVSAIRGPLVSEFHQTLEIAVLARRRGQTQFIVHNVDRSLYTATVEGDLPCLAGGCGEAEGCHANLCETESTCLVARDTTCCAVDADCDDGDTCTGTETCDAGVCRPGARVGCAPGDACLPDDLRCSAAVVRRLFDDGPGIPCEVSACRCLEPSLQAIEQRIQSALTAGPKACSRKLRSTTRRIQTLARRVNRFDVRGCLGQEHGDLLHEEMIALRRTASLLARARCGS